MPDDDMILQGKKGKIDHGMRPSKQRHCSGIISGHRNRRASQKAVVSRVATYSRVWRSRILRGLNACLHSAGPNQVVTSVTTFVVTALASRGLDPKQFGVFASVQIILLLVVGGQRAYVLQPVLLNADVDARHPAAEVRTRVFFAAGLTSSSGILVGVTVTQPEIQAVALLLAVLAPSHLYWDAVRSHYQGRHSHGALLYGDLICLFGSIVWVGTCSQVGAPLVVTSLGLGVGPLLGAIFRLPPWSRRWVSCGTPWTKTPARKLLGDYIASTGLEQGLILLSGAFLSVVAVGALRLAQTAIGPVTALLIAVESTVLPRLRDRRSTRSADNLRWAAPRFGAIALLCVCAGIGLSLLPVPLGENVFGPSWLAAASVVGAIAARQAATALAAAAVVALRTTGRSGTVLRIRLVGALLSLSILPVVLAHGNLIIFAWSIVVLQSLNSAAFLFAAGRSPLVPRNARVSS